LRVTFNPPGSITESRRIVKILLLKIVLLETTRAERFFVGTQYPQTANCKKWSDDEERFYPTRAIARRRPRCATQSVAAPALGAYTRCRRPECP
jgi:hypothetical protein